MKNKDNIDTAGGVTLFRRRGVAAGFALLALLGMAPLPACSPPASPSASASSPAHPATDWAQIREIAHESRRAHIAAERATLSDAERQTAMEVAVKCASAMAATRDAGLTPSQRIYKYQDLGKSHYFAALFSPRDEDKVVHLALADNALQQAAEAEREVKMDATWDDSDRSQFIEARGHTAFVRACVRARQLALGRATRAQVDAAINAIPPEYKNAHPPEHERALQPYVSAGP
jgi:hypothetical protein